MSKVANERFGPAQRVKRITKSVFTVSGRQRRIFIFEIIFVKNRTRNIRAVLANDVGMRERKKLIFSVRL